MAIRRFAKLLADLKRKASTRAKDTLEKKLSRRPELQKLEDRSLMAGLPVQIDPQPGRVLDNTVGAVNRVNIAPTEILFDFEAFGSIKVAGVTPQQQTAELSQKIKLVRAGQDRDFTNGNEVTITPGFLGIGDQPTEVIMRFKDPLPDDKYNIIIVGAGTNALLNSKNDPFNLGTDATVAMDVELGAKVVAVVPQPVTRNAITNNWLTQDSRSVVVYFEKGDEALDATTAQNKNFYQFYATRNSLDPNDQIAIPSSAISQVVYDPTANTSTITFNQSLYNLGLVPADGTPDPVKSFRLRIGTDETRRSTVTVQNLQDPDTTLLANGQIPSTLGPGWTFNTAFTVGDLTGPAGSTGLSRVYSQAIEAQPYNLTFPGGNLDPGHRMIPAETHLLGGNDPGITTPDAVADTATGIRTQYYNFRKQVGLVPGGQNGTVYGENIIDEKQKQLAREIFDLYSAISGIQFIERVDPKPLGEIIPFLDPELDDIVVATGDLQIFGSTSDPGNVIGLGGTEPNFGFRLALMDGNETWSALTGDAPYEGNPSAAGQQSWYTTAMHEIGHVLGLGHTYDLPERTVMGDDPTITGLAIPETVQPGDNDVVHMQHLYRPESKDIDMYQLQVNAAGTLSIETMAERLHNSSPLDTYLTVWREKTVQDIDPATGNPIIDPVTRAVRTKQVRELVARNDDYYSNDSALKIVIDDASEFGTYYVGVSAQGNDRYDPTIPDSGIGGTTQGRYELRLDFQRDVDSTRSIKDAPAFVGDTAPTSLLDGDGNGVQGGAYNFWFRVAKPMEVGGVRTDSLARTIFVEKTAPAAGTLNTGNGPDGSLERPFKNIDDATAVAKPYDIIRIVGNPGADGDVGANGPTLGDNLAYHLGFDSITGLPLEDGASLPVPKDVTVMVDAGVIIQSRQGWIGVGSTSPAAGSDRSGGTFQVLGTPKQSVYFTSYNEQGANTIGKDENTQNTTPLAGDWGGIFFRRDVDRADGRIDLETRGIFLDYINFADMRYGGGEVLLEGVPGAVSPVELVDARPTITNNVITSTRAAAMSANPDSFEETNFRAPRFFKSLTTRLNTDYERVGPDIRGNSFVRTVGTTTITNSLNGIFIRSKTPAGDTLEEMTVSGHFDDLDIVHIVSENLVISGTPGGARHEKQTPTVNLIVARLLTATATERGQFNGTTSYEYRLTFVDAAGNESPASSAVSRNPFGSPLLPAANGQFVRLSLPEELTPPPGAVARRIYRSVQGANDYRLIGTASPTKLSSFNDYNLPNIDLQQVLQDFGSTELDRARLNGGLVVDPRIIVKLEGSRIELEQGSSMIAEGVDGREVVFTSQSDTRWGAGGTFDTRGDNTFSSQLQPSAGDWAGIEARQNSSLSIDQAVFAYGGGLSRIEGASTGINTIEIIQAEARIANTMFEHNDNGIGGESEPQREGRGSNAPGVVYVRGAQPTIINNTFQNNLGAGNAVISANVNSLNYVQTVDLGRQRPLFRETASTITGLTIDNDRMPDHLDNQGPLIRGNRLVNNTLNGLWIRGGTLTTEGVWDDTDIAHVLQTAAVFDSQVYFVSGDVQVPDVHIYGGLRLESRAGESLVVKSLGQSAGLTATGRPLEIEDRIGGSVQVIGLPGFPVILTSLNDDTASAGTRPDGLPQSDTANNNQPLVLTPGPEVNTGTVIDNDLSSAQAGYLAFQALSGGESGPGTAASVSFNNVVQQNQQFVNQFLNYVRVGNTTISLRNTSVTTGAARSPSGEDIVTSSGSFAGANGLITWTVESRIPAGKMTVTNTIKFTSSAPLGNLQFINMLDANIAPGAGDDLLWKMGSGPGQADFRVVTLDDARRYGMAQGGVYQQDSVRLINATWNGFAGSTPAALNAAITSAGGQAFSPTGTVAGLATRVDLSLGSVWGNNDVSSAMSWTVDGTASSATITTFLDLIPRNPVNAGAPGEWRGIILDQYSNDRNVDTIEEAESDSPSAPDTNPNPDKSQFLGALADVEKGGDENLRLGFTVNGVLRSNSDVDVYTFYAYANTEVWIDLDRTTHALDAVVEIVDDQGVKQFVSDNSEAERVGAEKPFEAPGSTGLIRKMQKVAPYNGEDFYHTNQRDPAFRVTLTGPAGQHKYHVRVRSSNPNVMLPQGNVAANPDTVDGTSRGLTKGAYQLQVRLQETDEFGGSTIRFADIRNAVNGVLVRGLPLHSPLTGEAGEIANENNQNDTRATATVLGNLLARDRGTISISGALGGVTTTQGRVDVDWYQFDITYEAIQSVGGDQFPVEFDADYADGIGRPNINMYLYDSTGKLIVSNIDSNVSDDRPAPIGSSNIDDLSRGSVGGQDALIGPVALPVGRYFLAVTNQGAVANALSNTTTMRLEPINSVRKIVEDRVENYTRPMTNGALPEIQDLFDDNGTSAVPFHLGDVSLFVAQEETALREGTRVYMVDPFTGFAETELRNTDGSVKIPFDIGDIAFRPNRQLMTYELDKDPSPPDPQDDTEAGRYYEIDSGLGTVTQRGADGIVTSELDPSGAPVLSHLYNNTRIGWGINFNAIAFGDVNRNLPGERLLGVGNRGDEYLLGTPNDPYDYIPSRRNILYTLDPGTGAYTGSTVSLGSRLGPDEPAPAQNYPLGAFTTQYEVGEVPTQPILSTVEATRQRNGNGQNNFIVNDGQTLQVNDGRGITTYELDSGPELLNEASFFPNVYTPDVYAPAPIYTSADPQYYIGNTITDGDFFVLDPTLDIGTLSSTLNDETLLQFDSGASIVFNTPVSGSGLNSPAGQYDGQTITVTGTLGRSVTFEFDADGVPVNGGTTLVVIGAPLPGSNPAVPAGNLNTGGLAGALVTAITAQSAVLGISAIQVGNRVSFVDLANPTSAVDVVLNASTNLFSATAYPQSPLMTFDGSSGFAPVLKFAPASYTPSGVPNTADVTVGNTVPAGSVISFNVNLNAPTTFSYRFVVDGDDGGNTNPAQVAINIRAIDTPLVVAQKVQTAINGDPNARNVLSTKLAGDKLMVNGTYRNTATPFTSTAGNSIINMSVVNGAFPNLQRAVIRHEEGFPIWVPRTPANPNPVSVDQMVQNAVNNFTQFVAGADLNRINFPNFSTAPFTQFGINKKAVASLQDISIGNWFPVATSATGVTTGNIPIPFLADDGNTLYNDPSAVALGDRIATAVNYWQPGLNAVSQVDRVTITNGAIIIPGVANDPTCQANRPTDQFYTCGEGPGGIVTGMANLRGEVYVVTDAGGLYQILPDLTIPANPPNQSSLIPNNFVPTRYIGTTDLVGIDFQGVTPGPQGTENGRYRDMLFAVDDNGELYAIGTTGAQTGRLQPIFVDGSTHVNTGVANARGLGFSSLDRNLWQVMPEVNISGPTERQEAPDHGIDFAHDDSRAVTTGLASYHFGDVDRTTYNYPGGAHGSMVSNEFSLKGYSAGDQPVMYFNYFSDSGTDDDFRVSVSANDGDWTPVFINGTQNSGNWHQARISLGGFVGLENLRVKMDFVTGGDLDVGGTNTNGDELTAVDARYITDADTVTLTDGTIEFDSGYSLILPTGAGIAHNSTVQVASSTTAITLRLIKFGVPAGPLDVLILDADTPRQVADKIRAAIIANLPGVTPVYGNSLDATVLDDNVLNLSGAAGLVLSPASGISITGSSGFRIQAQPGANIIDGATPEILVLRDGVNPPLTIEFDRDGVLVSPAANRVRVAYTQFDSAATVAAAIRTAILSQRPNLSVTVLGGTVQVRGALLITKQNPGNIGLTVDGTNFGTMRVAIDRSMDRRTVGALIRAALERNYQDPEILAVSGDQLRDGMTFSLSDGLGLPVAFEFDSGYIMNIPVNGGNSSSGNPSTYIEQGDQVIVSDGTNTIIFEFDKGEIPALPAPGPNTIRVAITQASTQLSIARQIETLIKTSPALATRVALLGLDGTAISNGRVQLGGNPTGLPITFDTGSVADRAKFGVPTLPTDPRPGVTAGRQRIFYREYSGFTPTDVAREIELAIDASPAALYFGTTIDTIRPYRIALTRVAPTQQTITMTANTSPITLQTKTGIVKGYRDLINVIGRDVLDEGPLGLDVYLPDDPNDGLIPPGPDTGINDNPLDAAHFLRRGQDNAHEGVYIDDIVVGFVERGRMSVYTTGAGVPNDTFTVSAAPVINNEGPYQIEIRRSAVFGTPIQNLAGTADEMSRSFDTNDRVTKQIQLVSRPGANIADGQTFTLTDGKNYVSFEFNDVTIVPASGVAQGNLQIDFNPADTEQVIAMAIRNAINSADAKAVLNFSAATSDGLRTDQTSTDNRINVHGPASAQVPANPAAEPNDLGSQAVLIDLDAADRPVYFVNGTIGDRKELVNSFNAARDVDLFRMNLQAGQRIYLDIDALNLNSTLDTFMRIFQQNANGTFTQLASSNNNAAPGEAAGTSDSYLEFTAPTTGVYIIGISSAGNTVYDPVNGAGAVNGTSTGFYQLEVNASLPSSIDVTVFNDQFGDSNQFRDQGQIIIRDNYISNNSQWGVQIDPGARTALEGNQAHPGSVRSTPQTNNNRLAPGVVVMNNVIYRNQTGGIQLIGDPNAAGQPLAPVSFARFVNNSLFGVGGTLQDSGVNDIGISVVNEASPTLMNNIVANFDRGIDISAAAQGAGTIVKHTVFQGNPTPSNLPTNGDDPYLLANNAPLFVNPTGGNFYLQKFSRAIDSAAKSLLDRSEMERVRAPLGISSSPIVAPDNDVFGQERVDDESSATPGGVGDNKFADRGALERADFFGPAAFLLTPRDNGVDDRDPSNTSVALADVSVTAFEIQLLDQNPTTGTATGTGIDDSTVTTDNVILRDITDPTAPRTLVEGIDYLFIYDPTSNIIRLLPIGIEFPRQATYEIELDNNNGIETDLGPAIRDRAGNLLASNRVEGNLNVHKYTIAIGSAVDFGDAPTSYGVTRAQNGPRHDVAGTFQLGSLVTLEGDGKPSATANGDGASDDGISFMSFVVNGQSSFTAVASEPGNLDVWLDLNNNGVFEDTERIVASVPNVRNIPVGGLPTQFIIDQAFMRQAVGGTTFARFRLTKDGISSPLGPAPEGEVEDYQVAVTAPPFRNPVPSLWRGQYGLDVDANGVVEPLDLLWVIHLLNQRHASFVNLPSPSPPNPLPNVDIPTGAPSDKYYDVDGNNVVDAQDILALIAYFNSPEYRSQFGAGEGESAGSSQLAMAAPVVEPTSALSVPATLYAASSIDVQVVQPTNDAAGNLAAMDAQLFVEDLSGDNDTAMMAAAFSNEKKDETSADLLLTSDDESFVGPVASADDQWDDLLGLLAEDTADAFGTKA